MRAMLANYSFWDIPQGPERCLRIAGMFLMANELGPQWLPIQKSVCMCVSVCVCVCVCVYQAVSHHSRRMQKPMDYLNFLFGVICYLMIDI